MNAFLQRMKEKGSFALYCGLTLISPAWNARRRYRKMFGRNPDLRNPRLFNEKLIWLRVHCYNSSKLVKRLAHKYQVLDYVRACGCGDMVKECYGVWDSIDEIPWNDLPERCAIKPATGCGGHVLCEDKAALDVEAAKRKLRDGEKRLDYLAYGELQYRPCRDAKRQYLCERLLNFQDGKLPTDVKIYCFHGEPRFVLYCSDRTPTGVKLTFFDMDWNPKPEYLYGMSDALPTRPSCLSEMAEAARKLAAPFPFVRVDFFEEDGKPVFGEMTFTPAASLVAYHTPEGQIALGKLLDLSRVDSNALC